MLASSSLFRRVARLGFVVAFAWLAVPFVACTAATEDDDAETSAESALRTLSPVEIAGDLALDGSTATVQHTGSPRYRALRVQGMKGEKYRFTVRSNGGMARVYFTSNWGHVVAKTDSDASGVATLDVEAGWTGEYFLRIAKLSPGNATFEASGLWTNAPATPAAWEPPAETLGKRIILPGLCIEESWRPSSTGGGRRHFAAELDLQLLKTGGHVRIATQSARLGLPYSHFKTHEIAAHTATFEAVATDPSRAEAQVRWNDGSTNGNVLAQLASGVLRVYVTNWIYGSEYSYDDNKLECTFATPPPEVPGTGHCCGPYEYPQKTPNGWQCYHSDLHPQGGCRSN